MTLGWKHEVFLTEMATLYKCINPAALWEQNAQFEFSWGLYPHPITSPLNPHTSLLFDNELHEINKLSYKRQKCQKVIFLKKCLNSNTF